MKKLAIYINSEKVGSMQIAENIKQYALSQGCEIVLVDDLCPEDAEALISIGGDGTFLNASRLAYPVDVPIVGINLGTLGFLTEVEPNDLDKLLGCLIHDKFTVEKRMMLDIKIVKNGIRQFSNYALNDLVISRIALSKLLHLGLFINDQDIDSVHGDGIIISSPTGSTAYSMSAGGPIVEPDLNLLMVTPICPHMMYSKTFIAAADKIIRVQIDKNYCDKAMVTVDGKEGYELCASDYVEVSMAKKTLKMIKMRETNFYNILRSKIYKRGDTF